MLFDAADVAAEPFSVEVAVTTNVYELPTVRPDTVNTTELPDVEVTVTLFDATAVVVPPVVACTV